MQDTILRMLVDKHQPLRVKGASGSQHPSDAKLASVQRPTVDLGVRGSLAGGPVGDTEVRALADASSVQPASPPGSSQEGIDGDGRRLAKTPADKPWLAVYVNPFTGATSGGAASQPSVYYGKNLAAMSSMLKKGRAATAATARAKDRLKLAGIRTDQLPLDDSGKMRAIREGARKWERAGRMRGVKEEAMAYRRRREEMLLTGQMTEAELEAAEEAAVAAAAAAAAEEEDEQHAILQEGQEGPRPSSTSGSKPGEAVIAMSGGRGWTSLANEKIEEAMKTDYFRRNPLRGKPLTRDTHEMNPFLGREERIMNRLIQRQGAAPPYVELNALLESEMNGFRNRLRDSWVRRASRIILATDHLRRGLEPFSSATAAAMAGSGNGDDAVPRAAPTSSSQGEERLVELAKRYRDPEWIERERAFHDTCVAELNNVVRRYNIVAPPSVRRGLVDRQRELERLFVDAHMDLALAVSDGLSRMRSGSSTSVLDSVVAAKRKKTESTSWWSSPSSYADITPLDGRGGGGSSSSRRHEGPSSGDDRVGSSTDLNGEFLGSTRSSRSPSKAFLMAAHLVRRARDWVAGAR